MRIEGYELHPIRIPFKNSFAHARYERTETRAIIIVLRSAEGALGFGEILPRDYLTGETLQDALSRWAPEMGAQFSGRSFEHVDEVLGFLRNALDRAGRNLATSCGFETALLDLAGKTFRFGLGEVLGGMPRAPLPAGVVIDFNVATKALPRHAAVMRLRGTRFVKMKVGLPDDVERLSIVSEAVATPLRIDANGAWASAEEAVNRLTAMRAIPLASIEQPLPSRDLEGTQRIREETGIAVVADEALCTRCDAERLIHARAADIFNIRVAKCGGVLGSLRIVELAREHGIGCHLGTLVGETGILTRVAEVFGRYVSGFDWLDGKAQNTSLLQADVLNNSHDAVRAPLSASGLGVRVSLDRVRSYVTSTPA